LVLDFIGNIRLDKVTESLINEFIAYRQDMVTYTTYRGDLVVLKAMINYFYKRDVLEKNPFKHIPIRQISTNPVYLNEKDVEKLLNLEYDKRSWMRNFFRVALLTGFRRGELATLRWDNIDYEKGEITVYGKTGQRFFPIKGYDELKSTLDDIPKESPYVFHKTRKKDKGFHEDKLSTYTREVFNKLDFDPKYTLHSLRHTFGAHQYMGGTPLEKIQLMMGHKNIYVTQMYAHVDITGEDVSNGLTYSSLISQPFKKD
jgi:integrase